MKKTRKIILVMIALIFSYKVSAAEYTCVYDYSVPSTSGTEDGQIEMVIDTETNEIFVDQWYGSNDPPVLDPSLDSIWTEEYIVKNYLKKIDENNEETYICPDFIYGCQVKKTRQHGKNDPITSYIRYPLINSNLLEILETAKAEGRNAIALPASHFVSGYTEESFVIELNKSINEICYGAVFNEHDSDLFSESLNIPCEKYVDFYRKLETSYCKGENCTVTQISEYNKNKNIIKSYCSVKLKYSIYQDPCVQSCLKLPGELNILEGKEYYSNDCGLGQKLTLWIANIVRWGKYLIPVIVIVLGILDFIKAIAADKDDEMKKAQGRFVKRLIAAALIFIIPFILEFVLVKLGFNYNGCGIIDL